MNGIWLAAMVAGLVAVGVAAQLGWDLRPTPLPRWVVERARVLRKETTADEVRNV